MKKILSVLLAVVMVSAAFAGIITIPAMATVSAHTNYYNEEENITGSYVQDNYSNSRIVGGWFIAGNGLHSPGDVYMTDFGYRLDNSEIIWKVTGINQTQYNDAGESHINDDGWMAYRSAEGNIDAGDSMTYEQKYSGRFYRFRAVINEAQVTADYGEVPYGRYYVTFWGRFSNGTETQDIEIEKPNDQGNGYDKVWYFMDFHNVTDNQTQMTVPIYVHNSNGTVTKYIGYVDETNSAYGRIVDGNGGVSSNGLAFFTDDLWISISLPAGQGILVSGNNDNGFGPARMNIKYRCSADGSVVGKDIYYKTADHNYYERVNTSGEGEGQENGFNALNRYYSKYVPGTTSGIEYPGFTCDGNWHVLTLNTSASALRQKYFTGIRIPTTGDLRSLDIESIDFCDDGTAWSEKTATTILDENGNEILNCNPYTGKNFDGYYGIDLGNMTPYFTGSTFGVSGWTVTAAGTTITEFGYMTEDGSVTLGYGLQPTEDAVKDVGQNLTGDTDRNNSSRFSVTGIPVERGNGTHTVYIVARLSNGYVVKVEQINYQVGNQYLDEVFVDNVKWSTDNTIYVVKGETLALRGWLQNPGYGITAIGYQLDNGDIVYNAAFDTDRDFELAYFVKSRAYRINDISVADLAAKSDHTVSVWVKTVDRPDGYKTSLSATFHVLNFAFSTVKSTIESGNKLRLKVGVDNTLLTSGLYTDMNVTFGGVAATDSVVEDGIKYFVSPAIMPDQMDTNAETVLSAKRGGDTKTASRNFSIAYYVDKAIEQNPNDDGLKTLLVNMLNYGAAAQAYKGEDATANAGVADYQGYALPDDVNLENKQELVGFNGNKIAKWYGVGLNLEDNVAIRFIFNLTDTTAENVNVQFTSAIKTETVALADCVQIDGTDLYYYDLEMPANGMRTVVSATVRSGEQQASSTFKYSVESYAAAQIANNDAAEELQTLVKAMMKFGDAASAYTAK